MIRRISAFFCALLLLASMAFPALAATRASDYFGCTSIRLFAEGNSDLLIEIDVNATHTMDKVGATEVYVYEMQNDGNYELVYTFESSDPQYTSSMLKTNSAFAECDLYYDGVTNFRYYVTCAFYAEDETGGQTLYQNSYEVCAT